MPNPLEPEILQQKAATALNSARLLIEEGDVDGACDRTYYGMFYAARAALLVGGFEPEVAAIKSHNGLISAFGRLLVKSGKVPRDMGRALNRAEELRIVADYTVGTVEPEDAVAMLEQAEAFIDFLQNRFPPGS